MASKAALHRPQLKLEEFFNGSVKGFGFMHTRFGQLAQQFVVARYRINTGSTNNPGGGEHAPW